jgi:hypothetical protein
MSKTHENAGRLALMQGNQAYAERNFPVAEELLKNNRYYFMKWLVIGLTSFLLIFATNGFAIASSKTRLENILNQEILM